MHRNQLHKYDLSVICLDFVAATDLWDLYDMLVECRNNGKAGGCVLSVALIFCWDRFHHARVSLSLFVDFSM